MLSDMGTNYYTLNNFCKECGRGDQIHLGKSSVGWQFSFQYNGGQYYKSVPEMKKWLKGRVIKDEYGDIISNKAFWGMVEAKQTAENMNHAEYMHRDYPGRQVDNFIIDGYSFSDCEFS